MALGQVIQKVNEENSLTANLEQLSLEGFASLESLLFDIKTLMAGLLINSERMRIIASEQFEIMKEGILLGRLSESPKDSDPVDGEPDQGKYSNLLKKIADGVGLTGLATSLFTGLVGLSKLALPLFIAGLGAYIARRWENFDLENELDRMSFAGVTGAGLGALIGTFIMPGLGTLIGGVIGGIGGLIAGASVEDETVRKIKDEIQFIKDGIKRFTDSIQELFATVSNFVTGDSIMNFRDRVREYVGLDTKEQADARIDLRSKRTNLNNLEKEKSTAERRVKTYITKANNADSEEQRQYYLGLAESERQKVASLQPQIEKAKSDVSSAAAVMRSANTMDDVNDMSIHMDEGDTGEAVASTLSSYDLNPEVNAMANLTKETTREHPMYGPSPSMAVDASTNVSTTKNENFSVKATSAVGALGSHPLHTRRQMVS